MNRDLITEIIKNHEGLRLKVYLDTRSIKTVAYGFNLSRPDAQSKIEALGLDYQSVLDGTQELTEDQADTLLQQDIDNCIQELTEIFSDFETIPDNASAVLTDLIFNLGPWKFKQFHNFIAAIQNSNWQEAIIQLKDSNWAHQVPNRCKDDCDLLNQI